VGVSLLSARKLWRALGFASVSDRDLAFTDADVSALGRTIALVRDGVLDEGTTIAFARALGQSTDRLVNWQIEALLEYLAARAEHGGGSAEDPVVELAEIMTDLEALLVYTWRRKLAAAVHRLESSTDGTAVTGELTVGFADLVSYTRLAMRISQRQLGVLVQRFEGTASDVVTAGGGQVIKTVGDEVLFTTDSPLQAAVIGMTLAERMAADELLPDVRVGIAHGGVLRSLGDVFGATVNLAARLTALAEPGTVATDPATAALLATEPGLVLVPQPPREVSSYGTISPLFVTRADPQAHRLVLD
jgi:adenylate cyclase